MKSVRHSVYTRRPPRVSARVRGVSCVMVALGATSLTLPPQSASAAVSVASHVSVDRTLRDSRITESSGLARSRVHPGLLWTHNDSGDGARLFGVAQGGATAAVLTLTGVRAGDFEALAQGRDGLGRSVLYAGDIGDNRRARSEIAVHRVLEPGRLGATATRPITFRLRYPGGAAHDAEALLVDPRTQRMYVVTKTAGVGAVYAAPRAPTPGRVEAMTYVGPAPAGVTDGLMTWDRRVVLRGYTWASVISRLGPGGTRVTTALPSQPQGESITLASDGATGLVGSEGRSSQVLRVPLRR